MWQTTTVASHQSQGFILRASPHAFPFTNPRHSLVSYTIFFACLTFKPLFFKSPFTLLIHLFRGRPTERLPAHFLTFNLLVILSFSTLSIWPNQQRTPSSILSFTLFITLHSYLASSFCNFFLLLIPNEPLRLFICTPIILP